MTRPGRRETFLCNDDRGSTMNKGFCLRAVALVLRCRALTRLGRRVEAWRSLDEAEPLAKAQGLMAVHARILVLRGLRSLSLLEEHDHFDRALRLARRIGHRELEGRVLNNLGVEAMLHGRLELAERRHREALEVFQSGGLRGLEGMSLGNLGTTLLSQGRAEEAERWATASSRAPTA